MNADDLGIREDINDAIFERMARGAITSATILANGPSVTHAFRGLNQFPRCSFGVHLNLTEFQPLSNGSSRGLAAILDDNKRFNGNAIREVKITFALLQSIYQEWCAQIELLIKMGLQPSHFDAHHHVHTIPEMLPVLTALRRRYKIHKVRISRNVYTVAELPSRILLAKKRLYNLALGIAGFRTTAVFTDLVTFARLHAVQPPPSSTIELMTHPGASLGDEEARLLDDYWPDQIQYPVTLLSYNEL